MDYFQSIIFRKLDENNSRDLDFEEFQDFFQRLDVEELIKAEALPPTARSKWAAGFQTVPQLSAEYSGDLLKRRFGDVTVTDRSAEPEVVEDKCKCARAKFHEFDTSGNGVLEKPELKEYLKWLVKEYGNDNLSEAQLVALQDEVFAKLD